MSRLALATQPVSPPSKPSPSARPMPVASAAAGPLGYIEASAYPLTSLLFVVPLMVAYEVGTRWYASDPVSHLEQRIVAFNLMQQFFALWGAGGQYMPAGAVASILVAWHLARGDAWCARPTVLLGMALESAMYAVPLVALGYAFQHYLPLYPAPHTGDPRSLLVLSIGAGIYEELVFRLVAFNVLSFVLVDLLRMPRITALPVMVLTSAIAFSLYHYKPSGTESFYWETFVFRTLAGIYFGLIFTCRGFGLTAGAHAGYDIAIVLLRAAAPVAV